MRTRHGIASLFLLGLLGVLGAGCTQKKITECNALVQVINSGVVALEKTPRNEADPTGVADLKAMVSMPHGRNEARPPSTS